MWLLYFATPCRQLWQVDFVLLILTLTGWNVCVEVVRSVALCPTLLFLAVTGLKTKITKTNW